ncbi:putative FlgJ-like protein [Legionella beliardensis]|uniref:Putative FlgJ-like protein n=1 Tax=Legionella beliardensis TaxID=91822 RepID=A0A378I1A8_9GAMM|nr:flagellar biosynthesis protein FlgJ [Legionella beliardensis]STX28455.1 putative FlgJ-like protein [Legionella beliardensis]
MDVTAVQITLHHEAKDFLFEHYVILRRLFSNVLGQLETDYISIALINQNGQLFFLSSKPSIEQNLIEKGLWQYDGSYQADFIYQELPKLWAELLCLENAALLKQYKQQSQALTMGISIPTNFADYRAIFSFGFKRENFLIQKKEPSQCNKLLALGKYCLREIKEFVPFPDQKKCYTTKPKLKLIINNRELYEKTSR